MDTKTILKSGGILRVTDTYLGISFEKERFSLSTAIFGGGFKKINHAVNQKLTVFYPSPEKFPGGSVSEYLRLSLIDHGYAPEKSSSLLTAAKMEWHSHKTFCCHDLLLDAVTTGGVEKTAARAGSAPLYEESSGKFAPVGTINIIITVNGSLPEWTMVRSLISITEGKTAALQDLGIADVNTGAVATGTCTDGVTLICDPNGPVYTDAGTFSVLGALLAQAAYQTVFDCLETYDQPWNQSPLISTPVPVDLDLLKHPLS